jgi:GNAT superfamily N-acetyltransferase
VAEVGVLDNPIWSSLTTAHRSIARLSGRAARYAAEVSPFAAFESPTAFDDLAVLVNPEETVGLCAPDVIESPPDWHVIRTLPLEQMVCTSWERAPASSPLELRQDDVPEMLALTAATEPGPFLPATIQMGRYFGIREETGRLIAMAGERLKPAGFTEISAVCTDPAFRGRGHARALLNFLIALIVDEGRVPFLHVKADNSAISLYKALGFHVRGPMHVTIVGRR